MIAKTATHSPAFAVAKTLPKASCCGIPPVRVNGGPVVRSSKDARIRSAQPGVVETRVNAWAIMLAGVMFGLIGMHLTAVRPLDQKIESLEKQVADVRANMLQSSDAPSAYQTKQQVAQSLEAHRAEVDKARRALAAVRGLRTEIQAESRRTAAALAVLDDMTAVQEMLISQRDRVRLAAQAENDIHSLHDRLTALKSALLQDAHDTGTAAARIEDLLNLKDQLIWRGANSSAARDNVERLLMLRDGLSAKTIDVATAGRNLERLLELQAKLTRRNRRGRSAEMPRIEPQARGERLPLGSSMQSLVHLASAAARETTAARVFRGFQPLMQIALGGSFDERPLHEIRQLLLQQAVRVGRLNDHAGAIDLRKTLPAERRLPASSFDSPLFDTLVPWPVHAD